MDTTYANAPWKRISWSKPREWRTRHFLQDKKGGQEQYRTVETIVAKKDCKRVDSQTVWSDVNTTTLPNISYGGGNLDTLSGATPFKAEAPTIRDMGGDRSEVVVTWKRTEATWINWP